MSASTNKQPNELQRRSIRRRIKRFDGWLDKMFAVETVGCSFFYFVVCVLVVMWCQRFDFFSSAGLKHVGRGTLDDSVWLPSSQRFHAVAARLRSHPRRRKEARNWWGFLLLCKCHIDVNAGMFENRCVDVKPAFYFLFEQKLWSSSVWRYQLWVFRL